MNAHTRLQRHEDRGAALIIAIGFMVMVGLIVGGLASLINSGLGDSVTLSKLRNNQYAADAAVQQGIVNVRAGINATPKTDWCAAPTPYVFSDVNNVSVRINCTQKVGLTFSNGQFFSRTDVFFLACLDTTTVCGDSSPTLLLRADVNISGESSLVQSWSVIK